MKRFRHIWRESVAIAWARVSVHEENSWRSFCGAESAFTLHCGGGKSCSGWVKEVSIRTSGRSSLARLGCAFGYAVLCCAVLCGMMCN
jgi:hypothetical protein